eukprot:9670522-Alexandrium_andersonii.AAC.1
MSGLRFVPRDSGARSGHGKHVARLDRQPARARHGAHRTCSPVSGLKGRSAFSRWHRLRSLASELVLARRRSGCCAPCPARLAPACARSAAPGP